GRWDACWAAKGGRTPPGWACGRRRGFAPTPPVGGAGAGTRSRQAGSKLPARALTCGSGAGLSCAHNRCEASMRFLAFIGLLAIIAGILVAGYFFGGFFDFAATWEDPGPVASAVARGRNASS